MGEIYKNFSKKYLWKKYENTKVWKKYEKLIIRVIKSRQQWIWSQKKRHKDSSSKGHVHTVFIAALSTIISIKLNLDAQ